jgi:hypothetical protein
MARHYLYEREQGSADNPNVNASHLGTSGHIPKRSPHNMALALPKFAISWPHQFPANRKITGNFAEFAIHRDFSSLINARIQ